MQRTKIEWVRNSDGTPGYTFNPITGCLGPHGTLSLPSRCSYCYAHRLARGRLKNLYLNNPNVIPGGDPNDPFTPRYWPDRAIEPYKLKKPSRIFVSSMGEMFGDHIPLDWIDNILDTCRELPEHTFQILTKNPENVRHFAFSDNIWLGVTVTSFLDWLRVCLLQSCKAKMKFISFEPLLDDALNTTNISLVGIDWVIIGAQTQPTLLPKPDWVYRIIDSARKEGIPIFLKPNLHWLERIQEFPSKLTLSRKVERASHIPPRTPFKSGDVSQKFRQPKASQNDANLSSSQGQRHDKSGRAK